MLVFTFMLILALVAVGVVFYYGAIIAGLYKGTMMAHFRRYGEERRMYPLARFIVALGVLFFFLSSMVHETLLTTALFAMAAFAFLMSIAVSRITLLRTALPRWYFKLLTETTRQERRAIAYAWLRLPFRTRLRLNGDAYAFSTFVDEVRLTVVYGARDPDDIWATWQ